MTKFILITSKGYYYAYSTNLIGAISKFWKHFPHEMIYGLYDSDKESINAYQIDPDIQKLDTLD